MSWFDHFLEDVKKAGYVRLIVDVSAPRYYSSDETLHQTGNMEAFWYKNQKEPQYKDGWPRYPFWELCYKYKISCGAGNGHTGALQHQVHIIGEDQVLPEQYEVYDFRPKVNSKLLGAPVFSKVTTSPCTKCEGEIWHSAYRQLFLLNGTCDSCMEGDD